MSRSSDVNRLPLRNSPVVDPRLDRLLAFPFLKISVKQEYAMSERLVLEVFYLTMTVPRTLPDSETNAIRTVFASRKFRTALKRIVTGVLSTYPELQGVRVTVSV